MSNMITRAGILFVSISIMLYIGGVGSIAGENTFISDFATITDSQVNLSSSLSAAAPNVDEESSGIGSVINGFIDSNRALRGFINFFKAVTFGFPSLFSATGVPFLVLLAIGLPLTFIAFMAVASFLRSGS